MAKGGRKAEVYRAEADIVSAGAHDPADAASKRTKISHLDGSGDFDGNESIFVKQPTASSSNKQRNARNHQAHATGGLCPSEYAEEIDCKEVRQSLVSIERGKAKNKAQLSKETRAFKKHVEDTQKALAGLTTNTTRSLSSKLTSSTDLFERAYISSLPDTSSRDSVKRLSGIADPHSNSTYIHCKKLLSESTSLLAAYRSIETELHAVRKNILPAFDAETTFDKVLDLLDTGHKIGLCKIEKGVLGTPSTEDRPISSLDSSLYADGHEAASIWGTVVRKQENAVKKSVEAIDIQ